MRVHAPTPTEAISAIAVLRSPAPDWMTAYSENLRATPLPVRVTAHAEHAVAVDHIFAFAVGCQPKFPVVSDAGLFQLLVRRWHDERGASSSITQISICPSYQRIIAMGPKVIPFILRDLSDSSVEPDHWFWALQMLTGIDPVLPDDRGDMRRMALAWLDWALLNGYAY